jgi:hypothetical protein
MVVTVPVMVPPVMMTPVAEVTDAARTIMGQDDAAAAVRRVIRVVGIRVVRCSVEESPMKVMSMAEANAIAMEHGARAKCPAVECGTAGSNAARMKRRAASSDAAAMERRARAVTTSAAVTTAASAATSVTTSSAATMAAPDFGRQRTGRRFRDRRRAGIDQRHCLT